MNSVDSSFPNLPLLCLATAQETTTHQLVQPGQWTVIDFWTTRCTRCPAALDDLEERAVAAALAPLGPSLPQPHNDEDDLLGDMIVAMDWDVPPAIPSSAAEPLPRQKTRFLSICCGESSDTARRILEQGDLGIPKWTHIQHYYMDAASKETAKRILGFAQVPFYVFLDGRGRMVQKGTKQRIDWNVLLEPAQYEGLGEPVVNRDDRHTEDALQPMEPTLDPAVMDETGAKVISDEDHVSPTSVQEPAFVLDDMDF